MAERKRQGALEFYTQCWGSVYVSSRDALAAAEAAVGDNTGRIKVLNLSTPLDVYVLCPVTGPRGRADVPDHGTNWVSDGRVSTAGRAGYASTLPAS